MDKTLLFNPGPTNVSEVVRDSLRTRDICHREAEFCEVLKRVNDNIVSVLGGAGSHSAALFTSSGTGCNEAIISSIHGKLLVLNNGKYSDRLFDIAVRFGVPVERLRLNPLEPMDLNLVEGVFERGWGYNTCLCRAS